MVSAPSRSATSFLPLTELIQSLGPQRRALWDRLWMVSDKRRGPVHPLIYRHPETGKPVLCFHLGMTERFLKDLGEPEEAQELLDDEETDEILGQIREEILRHEPELVYHHVYG